jgi:pimeloyl-ACP methyl ester carboxylesterase
MAETTALNVRSAGQGQPCLVFVHGFGCSLEDWNAQVEALSPSLRCVSLDLPGHGASAMPGQATMAALGAAVNSAVARNGAGPVILVGHSLGCKVIREAFSQSGRDVIGLVFIEGALYEGERQALVERARAAIDSGGFAAYVQQHFAAMFIDRSDPALRERILARVRSFDPDFGARLYLEAVGWDPLRGRQTLQAIEVPVLVIQTTHVDSNFKRVPMEAATTTPFIRAVQDLCPRSEVRVIEGCGHFPMSEAAGEINRALREFALRVLPRPA